MTDVLLENDGSVVRFEIQTPEAMNWVKENINLEGWQWLGRNSFAVEHRFAKDIAEGMGNYGLLLTVL